MLRSLVLILLLLNLAFFSWTQGWLTTVVGVHPSQQHEPQRLNLQRHADQLEVIPPEVMPSASAASAALAQAIASAAAAASSASEGDDGALLPADLPSAPSIPAAAASVAQANPATPASATAAPTVCLAAGPFGSVEMGIVTSNLQGIVPRESWRTEDITLNGLWFVYMGPYPDAETLERKQAELRRIKPLNFEEVRSPSSLAMGFSLGRYGNENLANAALESMRLRVVDLETTGGDRTAEIIEVGSPYLHREHVAGELAMLSPGVSISEGQDVEVQIDRCRAAGMNDYLSKPLERDKLINVLGKYLKQV